VISESVKILFISIKKPIFAQLCPCFPFVFSLDRSGGLIFVFPLHLIPCRFFVACARGFFMCWFFCSRAKAIGQFSLPRDFRQCFSDLLHFRS
jgi:hypothetical protein